MKLDIFLLTGQELIKRYPISLRNLLSFHPRQTWAPDSSCCWKTAYGTEDSITATSQGEEAITPLNEVPVLI
jgi:hypothetical protein